MSREFKQIYNQISLINISLMNLLTKNKIVKLEIGETKQTRSNNIIWIKFIKQKKNIITKHKF